MSGEKDYYLEELKPYSNSYITFDDGASEKIKGICKLVYLDLPIYTHLLISGLCNVISSSFPLVYYLILFNLLSIIMFYILVCSFFLIPGSNEYPRQRRIKAKQNGAKWKKCNFSHTKTRGMLRPPITTRSPRFPM